MSPAPKPSLAIKIGVVSFFVVGVFVALIVASQVQSRGGWFASALFAGSSAGAFSACSLFAAVFWFGQALRRVRRWFAA